MGYGATEQSTATYGAPLREVRNHTLDSRRWARLKLRYGDVVIATWGKSGTTWLQQIVGELVLRGAETASMDVSPWVEHRGSSETAMLAMLAGQTHRRFMKTHLPADALPLSRDVHYIYVGRDGRDALFSWYHHHKSMSAEAYRFMEGLPNRVGPALEPPSGGVREYFHEWLGKDGHPLWPFWSHVRSWWELRDRPNVLLVHFDCLKTCIDAEIRRIAAFLQVTVTREDVERVVRRSSLDHMKKNAESLLRAFDGVLVGGGRTFLARAADSDWRNVLTAEDVSNYEALAHAHLGPACAQWLATGDQDTNAGSSG